MTVLSLCFHLFNQISFVTHLKEHSKALGSGKLCFFVVWRCFTFLVLGSEPKMIVQ